MIKTIRSILIWAVAAAECILALNFSSFAKTAVAIDPDLIGVTKPGPGLEITAESSDVPETETAAEGSEAASEGAKSYESGGNAAGAISDVPEAASYTEEIIDGNTIYTFEGKQYKAGASYGVHRLTGYSPVENGSAMTYSGRQARAKHTVAAASDLPIGTVIILKGVSGPYSSDYDGLYVVEDRGGAMIEQDKMIDIFFDTYVEAARTTDAGWNYAEVWIAEPVE